MDERSCLAFGQALTEPREDASVRQDERCAAYGESPDEEAHEAVFAMMLTEVAGCCMAHTAEKQEAAATRGSEAAGAAADAEAGS